MSPRDKTGLYIHIPFCRSKCPYCDFYSLRLSRDGAAREYIDALCDELETGRRAAAFTGNERPELSSIYIGGGTPSALPPEQIARVLDAAFRYYPVEPGAEVTVEANPASATPEFFRAVKAAGANRISLGLQSAVDAERRALGRLSGADGARRAFLAAREAGFENISLDLMLGVPGQTAESLSQSVDFCASLSPEHISAYMLQLEEGTPFYARREKLDLPDEDAVCGLYLQLIGSLRERGYIQYEISNFARPGFESRHNTNYWRCGRYIGVGAAAHSFYGGRRFFYPGSADAFIAGDPPEDDGPGGEADEYVMLALRTAEGLVFSEYEAYFGAPVDVRYIVNARTRVPERYICISDRGISLTVDGFLISNKIIAEVIQG